MDFNDNASIDNSEVEDRRGQGGGGGMLSGLPGGALTAGGGGLGLIGIIIVVILQLAGGGSGGGGSAISGVGADTGAPATGATSQCSSGADARAREDCRILLIQESIQNFWGTELPQVKNVTYTKSKIVLFTSSTTSGCGQASSDMGPFYCPIDKKVYLDLSFFSDMLQKQLGAQGGTFAEAYVVAHEYGHHVQDLLGIMTKANKMGGQGPNSGSVRLELQADCYAGVWGNHAATTRDANGNTLISNITTDDVSRAIDAAQSVGDDRIQQETQGRVSPEQWTHGSAAERKKWFTTGYTTGDMNKCDTFSGTVG